MIYRDGMVGAAGQAASTKPHQPPLETIHVVVATEASAARRQAPVRQRRSPSSSRAVVARRGGSGEAAALALSGAPWRRPHQVSLGAAVPCVSS